MLSLEEGTFLVKVARIAFFTYVDQKRSFIAPAPTSSKFEEKTGAYVRVGTFAGQKRNERDIILGFTGYPMPLKSLYQSVIDASTAIAARSLQPPSRCSDISFEVTALSLPEQLKALDPVRMASQIKLGRDALMIGTLELKKAIILPQTAVKICRNEVELLGECCTAAGLMADAWLTSPEIGFYKFQAQIFRERELTKQVMEISLAP
jgi:uncharacterized protein (TIGR00296 family)